MWTLLFTLILISIPILKRPIEIAYNLFNLLKALIYVKRITKRVLSEKDSQELGTRWSMLVDWKKRVKKTPDSVFLELVHSKQKEILKDGVSELPPGNRLVYPHTLTFSEADSLSDQIAFVFHKLLQPSPVAPKTSLSDPIPVAVLMKSSPFYVTCYFGLVKTGACSVLINHNLKGKILADALETAFTIKSTYKTKSGKSNEAELEKYPNILLVQEGELLEKVMNDPDVEKVLTNFCVTIVVKRSDTIRSEGSNTPKKLYIDDLILDAKENESYRNFDCEKERYHIPQWDSTFFYIFTSGTTGGKAKASIIKHMRVATVGGCYCYCRTNENDKVYCALPLYHSSAGMIGVSMSISSGATLVIKPKFSARDFARDILEYKCTMTLYIGEFARYALKVPTEYSIQSERILRKKRDERDSIWGQCSNILLTIFGKEKRKASSQYTGLRLALGNGMRPDVWEEFQHRFGISNINEFYGSTEGNASIVNCCNVVGAVGVVPFFVKSLYPIRLVKCNNVTGEILRDPSTNRAILAKTNEPGQLLGLISKGGSSGTDPYRAFAGYSDKKMTNKKVVHGIMDENDSWFATGDLLKRDWFGFYYWVDRIGDTFRWKGENVSTCEVTAAFFPFVPHSQSPSSDGNIILDANVYGVEVPGYPGRAGMARITLTEEANRNITNLERDFHFESLFQQLEARLPVYAIPLFLRFAKNKNCGEVHNQQQDKHVNSSFKQLKGELKREGYLPETVTGGESVFIRDDRNKTYKMLDKQLCDDLSSGRLKV